MLLIVLVLHRSVPHNAKVGIRLMLWKGMNHSKARRGVARDDFKQFCFKPS